jgi:hypothetical protein
VPSDPTQDRSTDDDGQQLDTPDPAQQFGRAAAADAELADRLTQEAGGDLDRAEAEFDDESRGPVPTETGHPRGSE